MKKIQIVSIRKTSDNTCEVQGRNLKNAEDASNQNNGNKQCQAMLRIIGQDEATLHFIMALLQTCTRRTLVLFNCKLLPSNGGTICHCPLTS